MIHRVRTAGTLLLVSAIAAGCGETRPTKIEKHYIGRLPPNLIRGMLEFADDGKTYAVIVKDNAGQHVVVGGRAEPSHEGCTLMQFAPRTRQLFYWEGDTVGSRRQVWIAGGIGVVPFVNWLTTLKPNDDYSIDLFYSVPLKLRRRIFQN